ncbi:MAG TPA: HDOD domain-containing protein [Opitutaceae bacterium]
MVSDVLTPGGIKLTPDDIVRDLKILPSAPKVLPKLKDLLADGNSSLYEIVTLIRIDPGIAARVLQTANSTYFSQGIRCYTVEEAVNRVGYDQIYELVSFAVSSQVLVRPLEVYGIEADELWKQSVACALAAETLAHRTNQDRNVAYTIGLLHALGMVAIDEWVLRNVPGLVLSSAGLPREATESERAAFGFTQAETGSTLLRYWGFPLSMSEPIRWQYAPRASASQARMSSLLLAAKWLRSAVCAPPDLRPALPEASQMVPLGLNPQVLPGMLAEVKQRLDEVSSLLEPRQRDSERHRFPTAPLE